MTASGNKLHSAKAASRGEPGYVWRSGQERRLQMVAAFANLQNEDRPPRILDNGCGLGTWLQAFGRYAPNLRFGLEIEQERGVQALPVSDGIVNAAGESLPFAAGSFDIVFSNEVLEHVQDDAAALAEMVRVLRPGGRLFIFCPNRWHWMEQHGIYWRGEYRFGNKPLVNYLPTPLRDRLAPHVRAYTKRQLNGLAAGLPVREIHHRRIFGGYDNIAYRRPALGRLIRGILYPLEKTPLDVVGLSHFWVLEKTAA